MLHKAIMGDNFKSENGLCWDDFRCVSGAIDSGTRLQTAGINKRDSALLPTVVQVREMIIIFCLTDIKVCLVYVLNVIY